MKVPSSLGCCGMEGDHVCGVLATQSVPAWAGLLTLWGMAFVKDAMPGGAVSTLEGGWTEAPDAVRPQPLSWLPWGTAKRTAVHPASPRALSWSTTWCPLYLESWSRPLTGIH